MLSFDYQLIDDCIKHILAVWVEREAMLTMGLEIITCRLDTPTYGTHTVTHTKVKTKVTSHSIEMATGSFLYIVRVVCAI